MYIDLTQESSFLLHCSQFFNCSLNFCLSHYLQINTKTKCDFLNVKKCKTEFYGAIQFSWSLALSEKKNNGNLRNSHVCTDIILTI